MAKKKITELLDLPFMQMREMIGLVDAFHIFGIPDDLSDDFKEDYKKNLMNRLPCEEKRREGERIKRKYLRRLCEIDLKDEDSIDAFKNLVKLGLASYGPDRWINARTFTLTNEGKELAERIMQKQINPVEALNYYLDYRSSKK